PGLATARRFHSQRAGSASASMDSHCIPILISMRSDRPRLHQLIEYIARGPISNRRLEITAEGKVKLRLKSRWADGTTHLLFTPGEFTEKLMALRGLSE